MAVAGACNSSGSVFLKPLAALIAMKTFKRVVRWFFCNSLNKEDIPKRGEYFRSFDGCQFGTSRTKDLLDFAKAEFDFSNKCIDEASSRLEKLVAISLVGIGWVASKPEVHLWAVVCLVLSAITGLLGRGPAFGFVPTSFRGLVDMQLEFASEEQPEYEYRRAKEYSVAAFANHQLVRWTHIRLLLSIGLLIAGLVCFACRL